MSIRVADEAKGRHVHRNDLFRGGRDRVVPVQSMKPELQTKGTWATRTSRPYLHTCMQLERWGRAISSSGTQEISKA